MSRVLFLMKGMVDFVVRNTPGFQRGRQEDAAEGLEAILELSRSASKLFAGKWQVVVTCSQCSGDSEHFENFYVVSTPIENPNDKSSGDFLRRFLRGDSVGNT